MTEIIKTSSLLQVRQRLARFTQDNNSKLKFRCLAVDGARTQFAQSLEARIKNPDFIKQGQAFLCGPAAFMHCIADDRPADYANYVLDLAEKGVGSLGKLTVKPSEACCQSVVTGADIDPVDWVALASLRDASNTYWRMGAARDGMAGITLGEDMKKWFSATGWFSGGVSNNASSWSPQSLEHLISINQRSDSHVCLLIRCAIIQPSGAELNFNKFSKGTPKTITGFPDHWVVLKGRIQVALNVPLSQRDLDANDKGKPLKFSVWCWGEKHNYTIDTRVKNITPAQFLPYYYGYVSAKR